jgi:hypothetical protein
MGRATFNRDSAERIANVVRRVEAMPATPGRIQRRSGLAPDEAGSSIVPCKLTAKTDDTTYTGDIYADGTDATATETGVTIRVAGMATGTTLPYAVWFHATKEKWAGADAWTLVGVPRWL